MLDWFTDNAGVVITVTFSAAFTVIALWVYWPGNKKDLQEQGNIPLHEEQENEQ